MYDEDREKTTAALMEDVGDKAECLRLGFLDKDDNEILHPTPCGMGYLLDVRAGELSNPAEIYAAAWNSAIAHEKP